MSDVLPDGLAHGKQRILQVNPTDPKDPHVIFQFYTEYGEAGVVRIMCEGKMLHVSVEALLGFAGYWHDVVAGKVPDVYLPPSAEALLASVPYRQETTKEAPVTVDRGACTRCKKTLILNAISGGNCQGDDEYEFTPIHKLLPGQMRIVLNGAMGDPPGFSWRGFLCDCCRMYVMRFLHNVPTRHQ